MSAKLFQQEAADVRPHTLHTTNGKALSPPFFQPSPTGCPMGGGRFSDKRRLLYVFKEKHEAVKSFFLCKILCNPLKDQVGGGGAEREDTPARLRFAPGWLEALRVWCADLHLRCCASSLV
jgi:hypothetical protein